MKYSLPSRILNGLLTFLALTIHCNAADWPTQLGDSGRRGVSSETVSFPLHVNWTYQATLSPKPAWPDPAERDITNRYYNLRPTMTFDRAFQPIAADGSVFFGSSADDSVVALDARTGREKWRFVTQGPIRFAPTWFEGTVLVGSDDGNVYCLDAADGSLRWKQAGADEQFRLPGNGRLMSLWPIRTGVVVEDATAYFVGGMFPTQGSSLFAVDAKTGDVRWKKSVVRPSQGAMLASDTMLFVPAGRVNPTAYKRADGKYIGTLPGAGGAYAVVDRNDVIGGPGVRHKKLEVADVKTRQSLASFGGLRMAVDGDVAYVQHENKIEAIDRAQFMQLSRKLVTARNEIAAVKKLLKVAKNDTVKQPLETRLKTAEAKAKELEVQRKKCFLWNVETDLDSSLIAAKNVLFTGGAGRVDALDVKTGKKAWSAPVDGTAHALAFANGRLIVSTDKGTISVFSAETRKPEAIVEAIRPLEKPVASVTAPVEIALSKATGTQGYCLVLGCDCPEALLPLFEKTRFRVVVYESDEKKANELRQRFQKAGLYGARVAVHTGPATRLPYPDYFANLVLYGAQSGSVPVAEIARVMRPFGGTAVCVGKSKEGTTAALAKWGEKVLPNWKVETKDGLLVATATRGRPRRCR